MKQSTLDEHEDSGAACPECGDEFTTEQGMKSHYGHTHEGSIAGVLTECAWCGESLRRGRHTIERTDNNFCDDDCHRLYDGEYRTGESAPGSPPDSEAPWRNPETLQKLYVERGMTLREVAAELGTVNTTIKKWMDCHGIETRSRGESNRATHPNYRTEENGYETAIDSSSKKRVQIHRLVVIANGADPHELFSRAKEVHHGAGPEKSTTPWDNRPGNLSVLPSTVHSKHHNPPVHSPKKAEEIRQCYADTNTSTRMLADEYGVSQTNIRHVVNKKGAYSDE